jgi:hypothetical protein
VTLTASGSRGSLDRSFPQARERGADALDYAALAVTGALAVILAAGAPLPLRELALLAFISYVPGRAVTTHWKALTGPLLALTTVAGSLSLTTLLAAAILWLHEWYPLALFIVEAVLCAASLLVGLARRPGRQLTPPASDRPARPLVWHPSPPDLLLPAGLALWVAGVSTAQLSRVDQWGLLPGLPPVFYLGLGLLVASIIWLVTRPQLSARRLVLHLVALVIVIAGTPALVYPAPRYPWVYKHVGVVQYINLHGALNQTIDIYQNYPGFFALMAWFDRVGGVSSPIRFAAWSETVVMLASCLAVYAAAAYLHLNERERWIGVFIFVVASWVDEVYFSPQALGYALSLFVLAFVLAWFQDERSYPWMRAVRRRLEPVLRRLAPGGSIAVDPADETRPRAAQGAIRIASWTTVVCVYGVLVFAHELSPYIVALQVTALTAVGRVRPRWLAPLLWLMALAYLAPRFGYINRTYGLLSSLGSFFSNLQTQATGAHRPYELGVRCAAYAAYLITLVVWGLAAVGVLRRVRAGRPTMVLAVLAFSPVITFFLTNYGGEAAYRVYFFSIPWVALLVASAICPGASATRRLRSLLPVTAVLVFLAAMILPAYLGDDELYITPPSEITAAEYFYTHAPPGSALILAASNFPSRPSGRYNLYLDLPNDTDPNLLDDPQLGDYQQLGPQSLPVVASFIRQFTDGGKDRVYVAFAESGFATARGDNQAPPGALANLEIAMAHSPQWSVFFNNSSTTIFLFH